MTPATALNGRLTVRAAHDQSPDGSRPAWRPAARRTDRTATVRLAASLHEVAVQNVALDMPGASLAGFAALNLEGDPQLDHETGCVPVWIFRPGPTPRPVTPSTKTSASGAAAPSPFLTALSGVTFKLPAWLGASIDLSAESIPWRGVLIRGARLVCALGQWRIDDQPSGATLPGRKSGQSVRLRSIPPMASPVSMGLSKPAPTICAHCCAGCRSM